MLTVTQRLHARKAITELVLVLETLEKINIQTLNGGLSTGRLSIGISYIEEFVAKLKIQLDEKHR